MPLLGAEARLLPERPPQLLVASPAAVSSVGGIFFLCPSSVRKSIVLLPATERSDAGRSGFVVICWKPQRQPAP